MRTRNDIIFPVNLFALSSELSFTIELDNAGIKAEDSAPSASSFLKLFGIWKTVFSTSAWPEAPKSAPITATLKNPNNREIRVHSIRVTVV